MHKLEDLFSLIYAVDLSQLEPIIREAERIRFERERKEKPLAGVPGDPLSERQV
jgi:hypothetical protein